MGDRQHLSWGRMAGPGAVGALPMERSQKSRAGPWGSRLQGLWLPQAERPTCPDWGCASFAPPCPRFWEVGSWGMDQTGLLLLSPRLMT